MRTVAGVISNFHNGEFTPELAAAVRGGKAVEHTAWNFHGTVYYQDGMYHEIITQHGVEVDRLQDASLQRLIERANERYGND